MSPRNARVHQVHVAGELTAQMRLISCEAPGIRAGNRVLVEMAPGQWLCGQLDQRPASGPGGVIMVTLDRR